MRQIVCWTWDLNHRYDALSNRTQCHIRASDRPWCSAQPFRKRSRYICSTAKSLFGAVHIAFFDIYSNKWSFLMQDLWISKSLTWTKLLLDAILSDIRTKYQGRNCYCDASKKLTLCIKLQYVVFPKCHQHSDCHQLQMNAILANKRKN